MSFDSTADYLYSVGLSRGRRHLFISAATKEVSGTGVIALLIHGVHGEHCTILEAGTRHSMALNAAYEDDAVFLSPLIGTHRRIMTERPTPSKEAVRQLHGRDRARIAAGAIVGVCSSVSGASFAVAPWRIAPDVTVARAIVSTTGD